MVRPSGFPLPLCHGIFPEVCPFCFCVVAFCLLLFPYPFRGTMVFWHMELMLPSGCKNNRQTKYCKFKQAPHQIKIYIANVVHNILVVLCLKQRVQTGSHWNSAFKGDYFEVLLVTFREAFGHWWSCNEFLWYRPSICSIESICRVLIGIIVPSIGLHLIICSN